MAKGIKPPNIKKSGDTITITDEVDISHHHASKVTYVKKNETYKHSWTFSNYHPVNNVPTQATLDVTPDSESALRLGCLGGLLRLLGWSWRASSGTLTVTLQDNSSGAEHPVDQPDVNVS